MATQTGAIRAAVPHRSLERRLGRYLGPDWVSAWIFYAPTLILLFALVGWPFAQGFYISFTRTLGTALTPGPWIGLQNYAELLNDRAYWTSLLLTAKFT